MKKLLPIICVLLAAMHTSAKQPGDSVYLFAYFVNNGADGLHYAWSRDGLHWKAVSDSSFLRPVISTDKLMRDPNIVRGADGLFHMVWTVSWNAKGIGYAFSKDLVHWSEQQYIPVMEHEDSARNCWAPEIAYDSRRGEYMIYWATTLAGRVPADGKTENGYNHRMYYTVTRDFRNFSPAKLLYDKGFNVIDATIVSAGEQFIIFLKDETLVPVPQKNLRTASSDRLTGGYSDPSPPITGNYWAEGPSALYMGGKWIVYFDKYRDHTYGAVVSEDLVSWTDISDKISVPKGMRHGTAFPVSREEFSQSFGALDMK
ncbi:glycoside hydrolase family 43 protein [Sediminibacterium soli]|uniref:glycoside hydrolase family 43 protein n=1 Tax=Sediminibacterium soli TaxID=2698829 RepID=UPI0013796954|nr:glycoside hydrolase family 43 protein [Sediminibacterium soli]NCI46852.1 glycoside hydrolase family 43 protein [Sediminibacterium soli]